MISNIIYNRCNVSISQGQMVFQDRPVLEEGICLGVYFIPTVEYNGQISVSIGISDTQGNVIINATDYRDYLHKGGGYFAGIKQLEYPCNNSRVFVNVKADQNLQSKFEGQLIFIIKRNAR